MSVRLPRFGDERGFLSFVEGQRHVPFAIGDVRWSRPAVGPLQDMGGAGDRGLIALRGIVGVSVATGDDEAAVILDAPDRTVIVPSHARAAVTAAAGDTVLVEFGARSCTRRDDALSFVVATSPEAALSTVDDCHVIQLPSADGTTTVGSAAGTAPFPIERLYWLFDVPVEQSRGSHAHKALRQLIVAAAGSFQIVLDDGARRRTVVLDRPDVALYVPHLIWRDLRAFTRGAVCLVIASMPFDEDDYLREYGDYVQFRALRDAPQ